MSFTVIIPSKTASNLVACLEALEENEPGARAIIVDDTEDGSLAQFCGDHLCDWARGKKPFIYARNINLGIQLSEQVESWETKPDLVLLNDDAILQTHGGFTALARACAEHPEYGLMSARIHAPIRAETDISGPVNEFGIREEPRMVAFVATYIPRSTIERVGLLDERFTGYGCDDDDYCLRVRNAGLKIGVLDSIRVDHSQLPSTYRPGNGPGDYSENLARFREKWGVGTYGETEWRPEKIRLFIATPCYGALTHAAYTASLLATKDALRDAKIDHVISLLPGDSLVPRARGVLTAKFLASGGTHLLFIDGDLSWKPEAVFRLLSAMRFPEIEVACGIYPRKEIPVRFPVNFVIDENRMLTRHVETGCIEVRDAPTGFLCIKRKVLARMMAAYPERKCSFREEDKTPEAEAPYEYDLFPTPIDINGPRRPYLSEDFGFSRLWQGIGGRVFCDPAIRFGHYGQHRFEGDLQTLFEDADGRS